METMSDKGHRAKHRKPSGEREREKDRETEKEREKEIGRASCRERV